MQYFPRGRQNVPFHRNCTFWFQKKLTVCILYSGALWRPRWFLSHSYQKSRGIFQCDGQSTQVRGQDQLQFPLLPWARALHTLFGRTALHHQHMTSTGAAVSSGSRITFAAIPFESPFVVFDAWRIWLHRDQFFLVRRAMFVGFDASSWDTFKF